MNTQKMIERHYEELKDRGYNVLGVFLYGSQNYELDYEDSDVDSKAIVLPTLNDIVFNKKPISTTVNVDGGLCDVKDIRIMFESYKKQNINFVETIFTKYKVVNPLYKDIYQPIFDHREDIARLNIYASLNCMAGMAMEKQKALCHPYPTIKDKIDKYGFDSKQLHHIMRLKEFITRYINREKYEDILISNNKEFLINVKQNSPYKVDEAIELADRYCKEIKKLKDDYMMEHEPYVNIEARQILDNVMAAAIKESIISELKREGGL